MPIKEMQSRYGMTRHNSGLYTSCKKLQSQPVYTELVLNAVVRLATQSCQAWTQHDLAANSAATTVHK